jgi:hypothetical protein
VDVVDDKGVIWIGFKVATRPLTCTRNLGRFRRRLLRPSAARLAGFEDVAVSGAGATVGLQQAYGELFADEQLEFEVGAVAECIEASIFEGRSCKPGLTASSAVRAR